jgi:hypothetical protein
MVMMLMGFALTAKAAAITARETIYFGACKVAAEEGLQVISSPPKLPPIN